MSFSGNMRIADVLTLTPLQQGLLFHASTAQGGDDVYAVQLQIAVSGRLDPDRLREAVHAVVTRHPHLAARFSDKFENPVQIIPANPVVPWRYVDLGGSDSDLDEQIGQVCAAERVAVCNLADQPAFRAALIRTAEDRHRFVLTNHHIVLDGWSLPIVLGEIFASYYGQRLPAAGSYRKFVTWLAGRDLDAARAAWREVLAGFDTPTLVGPPGRLGLGRRGVASYRVPEQTTRALSELARSCHTTVSTVLQAGWAQLLMSQTGRRDVAFGTTVSGRPTELAGADSMVGLLINTVPVRAHITSATTTVELLDQLQSAYNHTLEHQHLALSEIHRVTGQEHLFDTFFVYENYPIDAAALSGSDGLAVTEITHHEYNHYPLAIQALPGNELGLRVEFDTDVFDAAGIEALVERFRRLLVAMTADPARRLASIDVLDGGEHARLDGWGNRAVLAQPAPTSLSIPALFAAQVARAPEAVAVTFEGRSMTYRELDEAANRVAHLLAGHGVGPGQHVALLFSRSAQAIVAILAVLKTGAAYVPIDPAVPAARMGFMLDDAAPVAAITTSELADRLDGRDLPIIDVNDPVVDRQPGTALPAPGPENIAYLIYTSGTTGVPKGVAITHHNVTQLLESLHAAPLPPGQVWSQCRSLAFDVSVQEIFGALLVGGRLVVVPESVPRAPEDLQDLLVAEQVSVFSTTPSEVGMLSPEVLESVALVIGAPQILQLPVGAPTHQVPGAIHPFSGCSGSAERARHESCCRQTRPAHVPTRHATTGHIQLTDHPGRYPSQPLVQHEQRCRPYRRTDRGRPGPRRQRRAHRRVHRDLGGAVGVDHHPPGRPPVHHLARAGLTAEQQRHRLQTPRGERRDRRRGLGEHVDPLADQEGMEVVGGGRHRLGHNHQPRSAQQRSPDLPH